MFFGERQQDGEILVYVNSAQGNRTVEEAFFALGSAVSNDGAVPKTELLQRVQAVTGEAPPEIIFGRVAVQRHVAARLAALTRHEYTPQGVGKIVRKWSFIGHAAGVDWSCVKSLNTAVGSHLAARAERWAANLRG
jgi:hypothetical protein